MIKYALLATIIATVITSFVVIVFEFYGTSVSIASAVITALAINFLWWRFRKRQPTFSEKSILLIIYWILTTTFVLAPVFQV